jgi:DNA (cytosine-5)-methyltransferase 1
MKILNLYAGIGGNRRLWGDKHQITAVEYDANIASIYKDYFPNDEVVIGDAHQYLLDNFGNFDFIWSSPPCPTHSRINRANVLSPYKDNTIQIKNGGGISPRYPDMALYQEIILLQEFFKGGYCVENVIPYYKPLIPAQERDRHLFRANFYITGCKLGESKMDAKAKDALAMMGFNLDKYNGIDKKKIMRNCVLPEVGKHILDCYINQTPSLRLL